MKDKYFEERLRSYNDMRSVGGSDMLNWHIWKLAFNAGYQHCRSESTAIAIKGGDILDAAEMKTIEVGGNMISF